MTLSIAIVSVLSSEALLAQGPVRERGTVAMRENGVMFSTRVTTPGSAVINQIGRVGVLANTASVMGEVVAGKPYSAEAVTESVQVLADGNRIVNRSSARIYRDSEGRTRREQTLGSRGPGSSAVDPLTLIVIDDPVANVSYMLDESTRTARQLRTLQLTNDAPPAAEAPADAEGAPVAQRPSAAEEPVFAAAVPAAEGQTAAGAARRPNVVFARRLLPMEGGAEPFSPAELPPLPPLERFDIGVSTPGIAVGPMINMWRFPLAAPVTEDLGEQVLEGVLAEGVRDTQTIPAGEIGNERPIEIVAERWYSPELEAIVLRRTSDPRFGETSYRLVNVDRSEPPPELFMVPQDYRLETGVSSYRGEER